MSLQQLEKLPVSPPIGLEELEQILLEGKNLEAEGRLAESLAHWEAALRIHRNNDELMKHYRIPDSVVMSGGAIVIPVI